MSEWSDGLTGLDTAPFFREHVTSLLSRRSAQFQPILYGVSEVVGFQKLVDERSLSFGDALLVSMSHQAQLLVRSGDRVGRLGRDHFGYALLAASQVEASACEERLRASLTDHVFDSEEFELLFAFTWIGDSTRKLAEIEYDVDVALSLQHITSD